MRKKITILILSGFMLMSCSYFDRLVTSVPQPAEDQDIETVTNDDAEINAAIARAQETLPVFVQKLQNPESQYADYMIKVRFPYGSDDSAEHMWMGDLTFTDNRFTGVLADEPVYISGVKQGDTLTIDSKDVSDWVIISNDGTLLGGFTMHVFIDRMSDDELTDFLNETGFKITDEPLLP